MRTGLLCCLCFWLLLPTTEPTRAWIRINQLGYTPKGLKQAVWCSKDPAPLLNWELVDANSGKTVFGGKTGQSFGAYGPFLQTARLDFSAHQRPGRYYLRAGAERSPEFRIGTDVYEGTADFCLRYLRQQRCGFNPFLKDSCHTYDGYVVYGQKAGIPDSTRIDAVGGWHDASDYLKYVPTSANATYHLLMAFRDFPSVFSDTKQANGLEGKNGIADVLDEARWGLQWLLKLHPRPEWMFNQVADDRDHMGMRIPKLDNFYGRGFERPVYFLTGEPQQRGKYLNQTTGTSSTAAKFSSAFSLGSIVFSKRDPGFGKLLMSRSRSAFGYALSKPGNTQTASVKAPYIYAENNWLDDLELAAAIKAQLEVKNGNISDDLLQLPGLEAVTPWLGRDTAHHYEWYPFINIGHYELARLYKMHSPRVKKNTRVPSLDTVLSYYREGIERVAVLARRNAFYRGVPFIWCSNNLTAAFAMQCYWYRKLAGDQRFLDLEQASFDWLFGCNPWGTSMVYGLPAWGDTPVDPHSAFTHLRNYPIDGGLVDGPVYGSIFKNLIGIRLYQPDEYAEFQSQLAVYHDDYGDYSTNEPTMDGTASLVYLLAARESEAKKK